MTMEYTEWGRKFIFNKVTVCWYNEKNSPKAFGFCFIPSVCLNLFVYGKTLSIQWKPLNNIFLG